MSGTKLIAHTDEEDEGTHMSADKEEKRASNDMLCKGIAKERSGDDLTENSEKLVK